MSKYPHTIVFAFPKHWLVMGNHIKNNTLTSAPKIITVKSASNKKVLEHVRNIDWLQKTVDFKFVILRQTTSDKVSPKLQKSDKIFELDSETMQYTPFDTELLDLNIMKK